MDDVDPVFYIRTDKTNKPSKIHKIDPSTIPLAMCGARPGDTWKVRDSSVKLLRKGENILLTQCKECFK